MLRQKIIRSRRPSKTMKTTLTESYRGISLCSYSNDTPSSPPYCLGSKIKSLTKKYDKVLAVIGDDYSYSTRVIDAVI